MDDFVKGDDCTFAAKGVADGERSMKKKPDLVSR